MEIDNRGNLAEALKSGINLFLGAGFSVLAKDREGISLPIGSSLAKELVSYFDMSTSSRLSLPRLCTIIENTQRHELRDFLTERFTIGTFASEYINLDKIAIKNIFTTNIDDLIYKIFEKSERYYVNDLDLKGPILNDRSAINVNTLNGCIMDDVRPLKFTSLELASAFSSDPSRWQQLTGNLQQLPTLFWGYSFEDASTLEALSPETSHGRGHKDKWVLVHPSENNDDILSFYRALGLQIIVGDTKELLDFVGRQPLPTPSQKSVLHVSKTKELFPQEALPELDTVPKRPIDQFFQGEPPEWCDIYSGQLYKTSYHNKVRDAVNLKKNCLVVGIPACGKTTLLLQVAAELPFDGHKLVCEFVSREKAHLIENKLAGQPAIVFIDNFTDSLEAIELFSKSSNIQVVGADRDYYFDAVYNRFDSKDYVVVPITEMSPGDVQGCLLTIPTSLLSRNANERSGHRSTKSAPDSLFEVIERHLNTPKLKERYKAVLDQLEDQDARLRDLLLMISFVHKCRVPASFDMVTAFMGSDVSTISAIYDLINGLGAVVSNIQDDFDLELQDYFVPRSTIVAEAVLANASDSAFRRMYVQFHANIYPSRICHYDVFKRQGYNADFALKAFPAWENGKDFYEKLADRLHGFGGEGYLLQQGALYLSKKRRYSEAFQLIDQAKARTVGLGWSITNTHAIILFKANIQHALEPVGKSGLERSMTMLAECYRSDRRKPYHAVAFADQALKYWEIFGDETAREYLTNASRWLEDETRKTPWNQGVRRLLPQVQRVLR